MDTTQMDHWWGALGAIGCGLGLRYGEVIVGSTGLAGAVVVAGACFIMMMDALSQ